MITKWLTGFPKDVVKDVAWIKQSGVKCVNVEKRTIVKTSTGEAVLDCFLITFNGNFFQTMKARKIMDILREMRE